MRLPFSLNVKDVLIKIDMLKKTQTSQVVTEVYE